MNKSQEDFRKYEDTSKNQVAETYKKNHAFQTYDHVLEMKKQHLQFNKAKMTVWEAIEKLDQVIDESDPDADFPQIYHAFQTAEVLREEYPDEDWLHLVGLTHDLGKVLALKEFGGLPQWNVVGDTFPVGCPPSPKIVHPEFFTLNPDTKDARFNSSGYGIYQPNCGIHNLHMSFGHDEYFYQVAMHNNTTLPPVALTILRFHSFYAWHHAHEYGHFSNDADKEHLVWVQRFQKADLYSKRPSLPDDLEELRTYYSGLINKYFPSPLWEW